MPRPKRAGAPEPKTRSRNGCWPCKARKVKCGEEKPRCSNCERQGEACDYSIRLNWGGRSKREADANGPFVGHASAAAAVSSPTFDHFSSHARSRSGPSAPARPVSPMNPSSFPALPPLQDQLALSGKNQGAFQQYGGQGGETSAFSAIPVDPRIQNVQGRYGADHPSPSGADGLFGGNSARAVGEHGVGSPASPMLPPMRMNRAPAGAASMASPPEHRTKRLRLSPQDDSPVVHPFPTSIRQTYAVEPSGAGATAADAPSPYSMPYSPFLGAPLTPGSSVASEESTLRSGTRSLPAPYQPSPDPRRLSVNDLLIDNNETGRSVHDRSSQYPNLDVISESTTYGYDIGQPDLDAPKNDDNRAIALFSPPASYSGLNHPSSDGADEPHRRPKSIAFEADGYYARPVPVKIPRAFEPLPLLLLETPMNLLYFHHFLNHTARILVPHDCERNPFRRILPQLAVRDDDLLGLLLAFSASHRARLLCHPEPANRIAVWVQDVFPKLRRALDSTERISDSNLTTAIMLASLEIISPNAFEVPISWQNHLTVARQMIIARGGLQSLDRKDEVAYFLSRWFAYLDVLGSLSGSKNDRPLSAGYLALGDGDDDKADSQIDCLLGFTNRFVGTLARIAELAKQCEPQRIDEHGNVREDWHPPADVVAAAEKLRVDLRNSCEKVVYRGCTHGGGDWDAAEIYATNEAFHWAGLLHLLRRVLGRPSTDAEAQTCVREVLAALARVRPGGSAEACLLFPMFSAGCDARERGQREAVLGRLRCVEGFGMSQVQRARELVQRVWETGRPWECLVKGEFFG